MSSFFCLRSLHKLQNEINFKNFLYVFFPSLPNLASFIATVELTKFKHELYSPNVFKTVFFDQMASTYNYLTVIQRSIDCCYYYIWVSFNHPLRTYNNKKNCPSVFFVWLPGFIKFQIKRYNILIPNKVIKILAMNQTQSSPFQFMNKTIGKHFIICSNFYSPQTFCCAAEQ